MTMRNFQWTHPSNHCIEEDIGNRDVAASHHSAKILPLPYFMGRVGDDWELLQAIKQLHLHI